MISFPTSRRAPFFALAFLLFVLIWRTMFNVFEYVGRHDVVYDQTETPLGVTINVSLLWPGSGLSSIVELENHVSPAKDYFYHERPEGLVAPATDPNLLPLWACKRRANKHTKHIRLPNAVQNISLTPSSRGVASAASKAEYWNPAIIALPYWSPNQYLVVSRVLTAGYHQESVICEANPCYSGLPGTARHGEVACTEEDIVLIGPSGGLRCVTDPLMLEVPATPARHCEGTYTNYVDIPGFHDPRVFYSGRGEPLMIVNSQSRYACFGLWLIDLRSLYPPLHGILSSSPRRLSLGPVNAYGDLTELTRNPPESRNPIEKNWLLFFPPDEASGSAYVHYDLPSAEKAPGHYNNDTSQKPTFTGGRTFAQLLGNGLTSPNLTSPFEIPCLPRTFDSREDFVSRWHQATNSLRLVLCDRPREKGGTDGGTDGGAKRELECQATPGNTVFFAVVHRKVGNAVNLPLRYERHLIVWAAEPPFHIVAVSSHPILLANETAGGWDAAENWDDGGGGDDNDNNDEEGYNTRRSSSSSEEGKGNGTSTDPRPNWAQFTYTLNLAWAWRGPDAGVELEGMAEGYLDDEVVLAIGIDDLGQGFARVRASDLLDCLVACPGLRS